MTDLETNACKQDLQCSESSPLVRAPNEISTGESADISTGTTIINSIVEGVEYLADQAHETATGDKVVFEMGMTNNLSILPSDLQEMAEHFDTQDTDSLTVISEQDLEVGEQDNLLGTKSNTAANSNSSSTPLHAYITLLGAVFSLSSIGPSLRLQARVEPTLKIYWRMTGTYLVLGPLALSGGTSSIEPLASG